MGILLVAVGLWQKLDGLKVIGNILAAPVIWAYAVLLLVYIPFLLFDGVWRRLRKSR
ncbi:MAG: hypothetical protein ABI423_06665 [Burkholderiales bacterium]